MASTHWTGGWVARACVCDPDEYSACTRVYKCYRKEDKVTKLQFSVKKELQMFMQSFNSVNSNFHFSVYGLDDRGVTIRVLVRSRIFTSPYHLALGPMDTEDSFPGVKQQGCEADHSPPTTDEVKKSRSIHPLPHTSSWHSA
jgi:hypothetical protein